MSLFPRLLERRDTSFQTVWGADLEADASPFNVRQVSRDKALGLSAVYACIRLIADAVASLPLKAFERDGSARLELEPQPDWIMRPVPRDPAISRAVHLGQVMTSLLLEGNAFVLVAPDVTRPVELRVLDPRRVEVKRAADGSRVFRVHDPAGRIEEYDWTSVIHVPLIEMAGELRGVSPLEAERLLFQSAIAAEELAGRFVRTGTWLSAMVEMPAGQSLTETQADALIDKLERKWGGSRNAGRVGILTGGATLRQLSVTPEQAQFLQTRQYDDERIFRVFRCPPALVGMTREGATSYASSVMQSEAFEKHTIRPLLDLLEAAYGILVGPGRFLRFSTGALLRADLKTRYEAHNISLQGGWRTRDEVRRLEDEDPLPEGHGGVLATPNNTMRDPRYEDVAALVSAGYDPAASLAAVGLPPITHTGLPPVTVQPRI